MATKNRMIKKTLVSTTLMTSLALSPMMTGNVFAHGAPEADANAPSAEVGSSESTGVGVAILSQGDQGQEVTDLQQKLQEQGYDINTDGVYGPNTQQKIIEFQYDQGWDADGVVDTPTLNALNNGSAAGGNATGNSNAQVAEPVNVSVQSQTVNASGANSGDSVSIAQSLVGTPYVWGGTDPSGFDSSGFINYVFKQQGISLSRTHAGMWANDGVQVDNPQPGDVVFFEGTYGSGVSHSGIYLGNHQMIHAGTEATGVEVTSSDSWDYYWGEHYIGAKRF